MKSLPIRDACRIGVVSPDPVPSFSETDIKILSTRFTTYSIPVRSAIPPFRVIKLLQRASALLVWFAGKNAVAASCVAGLYDIPVIVVIGGFEAAWVEELRYGVRPGSWKEAILRQVLKRSRKILTVSEFSRREMAARFPEHVEKLVLVRNAVDTSQFFMPDVVSRSGVVSVGAINHDTIARKSLDLFAAVAQRMPDVTFSLIGPATDRSGEAFVANLPRNLTWLGPIPHGELASHLQAASVYFQASIYESFCVALAEAMSCGCFPVISNRAALPEVAGPTATVLEALSPAAAVAAVRTALARDERDRSTIRQRIEDYFDVSLRREQLLTVMQQTIDECEY